MDDQELYDEIIWVMTYFGSDAGERSEPGSKLRSQAKRIVDFVNQRAEASHILSQHGMDLVKVVSRHTAAPEVKEVLNG